MLSNLLESKPRTRRSLGGSLLSVVTHAALIALAVRATLNAGQPKEDRATKVVYADVKKDEPLQPKKPLEVQLSQAERRVLTLTAPLNIPDELPAIDLSRPPTDESVWVARGTSGGRDGGVDVSPPVDGQIYFEYQVEKPVMAVQGSPAPRYPELLKAAGVEGEVVVSFVVDTTGRAELASVQILKATNELFGAAVRTAIPNMRFLPAEVGGRKVKQRVMQPFVFAIAK